MSVDNPSDDTARLSSLLEWREPVTSGRILRAGGWSIIAHLTLVAIFLATPDRDVIYYDEIQLTDLREATPLYLPRDLQLTQRDPNEAEEVTQQLDIRSSLPAAPAAPTIRDFRPPAPAGPTGRPAAVAATEIEQAPDIQPPVNQGVTEIAGLTGGIPAVPEPKVILEDLGPAPQVPASNPRLQIPRLTVAELGAGGGGGGGGAVSNGSNASPSSAPQMQLLSDPNGADFKPYLLDVLAKVRGNWFSVVPDDARRGRPGAVTVEFIIARDGTVTRVVVAKPSGIQAYNLHSVGSISASEPFPALPSDYPGSEIRLQLAFTYNLPTVQ